MKDEELSPDLLEIPIDTYRGDKYRSKDILDDETLESEINTADLLEALASSSSNLENLVERSEIN